MASTNLLELGDATFDETVRSSNVPVLVDFWGERCQPCMRLAPILEELSDELAGRVVVAKVNAFENQSLGIRFGVNAVPTVVILKDGEVVERFVGAQPKASILARLAPHM